MTEISTGLARPADETGRRPSNRLLRAFPALAVRDYRLLLGGVFLSMNGWMMQQVVLGWYVLETTNSAFQLGLVLFFNMFPTLVLSIPGGVLADRMDKRVLMLITQVSTFVIYAALALMIAIGQGHVWVIYLASVLTGLFLTLRIPAQQAIVVEIVGRESLANAVAMSSASFNATRIVGPAVAAGLVATVGTGVSILVIGISYLAAAVATWFLHYRGTPSVSGGLSFAEKSDGRVEVRERGWAGTGPTRVRRLLFVAGPAFRRLCPRICPRCAECRRTGIGGPQHVGGDRGIRVSDILGRMGQHFGQSRFPTACRYLYRWSKHRRLCALKLLPVVYSAHGALRDREHYTDYSDNHLDSTDRARSAAWPDDGSLHAYVGIHALGGPTDRTGCGNVRGADGDCRSQRPELDLGNRHRNRNG